MNISAPCVNAVFMPPAALVRISALTPSRPSTRIGEGDRPEIVSLVEVRASGEHRHLAPATRPRTSLPAWPTTAEAGQCGMSAIRELPRALDPLGEASKS